MYHKGCDDIKTCESTRSGAEDTRQRIKTLWMKLLIKNTELKVRLQVPHKDSTKQMNTKGLECLSSNRKLFSSSSGGLQFCCNIGGGVRGLLFIRASQQ